MKIKRISAIIASAVMTVCILGAGNVSAVEYIGSPGIGGGGSTGSPSTTTAPAATTPTYSNIPKIRTEYFSDCVKVSWDENKGVQSYIVRLYTEKGQLISSKIINSGLGYCTIAHSDFGVDYYETQKFYISVWGVDSINTVLPDISKTISTYSQLVTVKGNMSEYPKFGIPKDIKCNAIDDKLVISWDNTAPLKEKTIFTVSVIEVSSKKSVFSTTTTDMTATVKGLKDGIPYRINIFNKKFSASAGVDYTYTAPKASLSPEMLTAPSSIKAKAEDGEIKLTWSKVKGADAYRVYKYDTETGKYKTYKTVKGTNCTINNLKAGTTYKFKVCALVKDSKTGKYKAGPSSVSASAKAGKAKK